MLKSKALFNVATDAKFMHHQASRAQNAIIICFVGGSRYITIDGAFHLKSSGGHAAMISQMLHDL